jgi:CheY-like chemotaxis protein
MSRRVLVIDDDAVTANSFCELLSQWGHSCVAAYDSETALATAFPDLPQVVLLDIALRKISGPAMCRRLGAGTAFTDTLLIAITGHTTESLRSEAFAAGCDHVLLKPDNLGELRAVLDEYAAANF